MRELLEANWHSEALRTGHARPRTRREQDGATPPSATQALGSVIPLNREVGLEDLRGDALARNQLKAELENLRDTSATQMWDGAWYQAGHPAVSSSGSAIYGELRRSGDEPETREGRQSPVAAGNARQPP